MTEIKKDGDAAAHAPKSGSDAGKPDTPETGAPSEKQDAKNYEGVGNDGRSLPVEDMNSVNDE